MVMHKSFFEIRYLMDINFVQLTLLFFAGLGAGVINALAGGGSFMTVPLLIFTGLEPTVANATNRLAVWIQCFFGTRKLYMMGYFPKNYCFKVVWPMLAGTLIGAYLLTVIPDETFRKYFAFFMVLMTLVTFFKPASKIQQTDVGFTGKSLAVNYFIYFFIGIYIGFIQAGVGFMIIAASVISGLGMVRANAVKMFLNLSAATISLIIFFYAGKVLILPALAMGAGMSLSAVIASGMSVKVSDVFLKRLVSVVILIFAVLLLVTK